ncbi:MAG: hydantoinase/oxoprolinase family protein, partial [Gammaproteobacteria bacterium]
HLRGYHPEDFAVFAFGGGGPTHVAGFRADVPVAVIFPQSPVFCALGSSVMDIMHVYEQSRRMVFMEPVTERLTGDYQAFNDTVDALVEQARIDIAAEGFDLDDVVYAVELDMLYGGQVQVKRVSSPHVRIDSPRHMQEIYDAFEAEFAAAFSPHVIHKPGGVYLDNIVLKATIPTAKPVLPEQPLGPPDASAAIKGARAAYWPELGRREQTTVYRFEDLRPGHRIDGPALVEAEFTTLVVPPGQFFHIDTRGLGLLEYTADAAARGAAA